MKFRLMLASIVAVTASLSFAEGAGGGDEDFLNSSNLVAVLKVDSTAKQTIVSTPWVSGAEVQDGVVVGDISVKVSELVKAANLTVGDGLQYYDSGKNVYKCWTLQKDESSADPDAKKWVPNNGVSKEGYQPGSENLDETIDRGEAMFILRNSGVVSPIYTVGMVSVVNGSVTQELKHGWNLIAPPVSASSDFSTWTWTNVDPSDTITFQLSNGTPKTFKYSSSGSPWPGRNTKVVPRGTGLWFHRIGSDSATVEWSSTIVVHQ